MIGKVLLKIILVVLGIAVVLYGMANPLANVKMPNMPNIQMPQVPAQLKKGMSSYKALIVYGIVAFFTIMFTEYLIAKFSPYVETDKTKQPATPATVDFNLKAPMGTFGLELLAGPPTDGFCRSKNPSTITVKSVKTKCVAGGCNTALGSPGWIDLCNAGNADYTCCGK